MIQKDPSTHAKLLRFLDGNLELAALPLREPGRQVGVDLEDRCSVRLVPVRKQHPMAVDIAPCRLASRLTTESDIQHEGPGRRRTSRRWIIRPILDDEDQTTWATRRDEAHPERRAPHVDIEVAKRLLRGRLECSIQD